MAVRGYRSGLDVTDGVVHIWNEAAKSDRRIATGDIVGVTWKKPGFARGYVSVQTPDCPPPAGLADVTGHPQSVVLALGEWRNAHRFILAAQRWAAANDHPDPFAAIARSVRSDKRVKDKLPGLRGQLEDGEVVEFLVAGLYDSDTLGKDTHRVGVLAATDRRVLLYGTRRSGFDSESITYTRVSSVDAGRSLGGGRVTIHTANDKLSMSMINVGDIDGLVSFVRRQVSTPTPPAPAAAGQGGLAGELAQLAELHAAGALDDEEFAAAKARLLG